MNINNISNSGDGNIFNQNIGDTNIYGMSVDELAQEWWHSKRAGKDAFRERIKTFIIQAIVSVMFIGVFAFLSWRAGAFESINAVTDFVMELSIQAIASLLGLVVGAISGVLAVTTISRRDEVEEWDAAHRREICLWIRKRSIGRKEWKAALKRARGNNADLESRGC